MEQISLSKEFIIQRLEKINFPQINKEDYNDYAELILALEENHFSRQQFQKELMEVFRQDGENEQEKKISSITETKINLLLQEIYKEKLNLKHQSHIQVKAKTDQHQQLRPSIEKIEEQQISKQKENKEILCNESKEKQISLKIEKKQGILSRIKKHTQNRVLKKVKKEYQMQPNPKEQSWEFQQDQDDQSVPAIETQLQQINQMNQMYQMMLSAMQSQTKTKIKSNKKIRCKYWPNCKEGEKCQYHHPTEKCKNFPNCPFGSQCLYIHPEIPCKFGIHCKRPNCSYSHKPQLITKKTVSNNPKENQTEKNNNNEVKCNDIKEL